MSPSPREGVQTMGYKRTNHPDLVLFSVSIAQERISPMDNFARAARLSDVKSAGCLSVQVAGHTLALFAYGDKVYAVDNRCPHMGFPLSRGTVKDGILTCH